MKPPSLRSHKGDPGCITYPDGNKEHFTITDEIQHRQTGADGKKIICLQRIQFDKRKEIRFAYYVIGKTGRMRGRWVWGQYATFVPVKDFKSIISKAKSKGWI